MLNSPIAAIATAPGRGGVGIVRLSGAGLASWIQSLTGKPQSASFAQPRIATLTQFLDDAGQVLDEGLLIYFVGPHSFTGEDVIELQGHGGPVVMQLLLSRCLDLGARLAEPGEFTRRAFLNGKLDLAQAEAVADLINASTATAARSAVRSLQGDFSRAIDALMDPLIELRALTEATLDFPEEEVDFLKSIQAEARLQNICEALGTVQASARQKKLLQDGLTVVLIGQPNVGKSSLLNALAGEDLAIVTPVAGTTRDVVRAHLQIEGVPLHVIDTAGLHETSDEVERLGIERTWKEIEKADVAVLLTDAQHGLTAAEEVIIARLPEGTTRVIVQNKIDLAAGAVTGADVVAISAKKGTGVDRLRARLLQIASWQPGESLFIARERHLRALSEAAEHLATAAATLSALEIFAEELRLAHKALQSITGEYTPDDLLGAIFSKFCIGK
ncbi:MAG: tRNA-5-carboxymethylaminomethyl-2-thiouridine(34) synthesis protein MnmE [Fluviibacter phosphoraccumulans EoVTN8]